MVKGKVTKLTNFGVFVELETGLEGLLHISELADHKVENPEEIVKVGEEIEVRVLRVDTAERKIGLSRAHARCGARGRGRRGRTGPGCGDASRGTQGRNRQRFKRPALFDGVAGRGGFRTPGRRVGCDLIGSVRTTGRQSHDRRNCHCRQNNCGPSDRVRRAVMFAPTPLSAPRIVPPSRVRNRVARDLVPINIRGRRSRGTKDSGTSMQKTTRRRTVAAVQSPLETYLREINETALLTANEEKELSYGIEQGNKEARDRMVRANLRLVVNIARGYTGKGLAACKT